MKMTPEEFFDWIGPAAMKICGEYGLYPSVCMAQAAIESGWGGDIIGEFNVFGRKAVDGDRSIVVPTEEQDRDTGEWSTIDAAFKLYDSLEEAIRDYCILLTGEGVYLPALIFVGKSRDAYIDTMAPVYATRETYPEDIKSTILANDLDQYDKGVKSYVV